LTSLLFVREEEEEEALALSKTAGYEVSEVLRLPNHPNYKYFIGEDKLSLISDRVKNLIVFDLPKPRQVLNIIKVFPKVRVVDKAQLILEIFALHAGSKEAKLQIEMAKLKHEAPLVREWVKRVRSGEQQGPLGAGMYEAESYFRLMKRRTTRIRRELLEIKERVDRQIYKQKEFGMPQIAILGYTNAGKTSIFNAITGLKMKVNDSLFTTMSPKRYAISAKGRKVVLVDSVGFIRGIPPQIIDADGILLVADSSVAENRLVEMVGESFNIMRDIGVSGKPLIIALNKADKAKGIHDKVTLIKEKACSIYSPIIDVIPTSAIKGTNLDKLMEALLSLG
jgi:GTP-binding protein HflX